jgi:uncharacterized delta-60 repeat protein
MRTPVAACIAAVVLGIASAPAHAANHDPVRLWSVSRVDQGTGAQEVEHGGQVGGELFKRVSVGDDVAFNLPLPSPYWENLPRDSAFGALFSSASGQQYSVLTQAPVFNPFRPHAPKGSITHLDEYQAYEKRAGDASLKITVSGLLLEAVDGNNRPLGAFEGGEPIRTVVRFHARAYAASAGGDFYDEGGSAYLVGHQHSWRPGAATSADSAKPLWGEQDFDVNGDRDDSGTGSSAAMSLKKARHLKVPLDHVRTGELFAVHVSLEAEAVDDLGGESAAQAAIQDPQHLLTAHGLKARGKPRFAEPHAKPLSPARCPRRTKHAGRLQISAPAFTATESDRTPMVLVTRTGGKRGPAGAQLTTRAGTARPGADFKPTRTTVRFAAGDTSPRLLEIPIREDAVQEPAETFGVRLGHARCASVGARHRATVTIADDDLPPPAAPAPPAPPTPTPQPPAPTPAPVDGLDPTFGNAGRVSTPVGGGHGEAVVIQPSGGIVTAGWHTAPRGAEFALTRHDTTGRLDTTFGTGGIATTDLGGDDDEAYDAALLPGGGIVAVGRTDAAGILDSDFGVARYTPDGKPDGAVIRTDIFGGGDQANAVAVQPDGKIVVAGFATRLGIDGDFAVVRYLADGKLDDGFGTHGIVTTDLGTEADDARAIVVRPDGSIVVAGSADEDIGLARYSSEGKLEGTTVTDLGSDDVANGVALTPDGHILVAGYTLGAHTTRDFLLLRYDANGKQDATFPVVRTDVLGGDDYAENLVVDGQGRIVVVGRATSSTILDMAIVRYRPDGTVDRKITADFRGHGDFGQDVALDPQGRIVAAGYDTDFELLRALP